MVSDLEDLEELEKINFDTMKSDLDITKI